MATTRQSEAIGYRLHRANAGLNELQTWLGVFGEMDPYRLEIDYNSDTGLHELTAELKVRPPGYVSVIAGEVIQHLRAVLDYVVWGLASVDQDHLIWPTCQQPSHFKSWKLAAGPKSMHEDVLVEIENFQAYKSNDPLSIQRVLFVLNRLSTFDKHRTLALTEGLFLGGTHAMNPDVTWYEGAFDGDKKVLATWRDPIDEPKGGVVLSVAFEKAGEGRGHDVEAFLRLVHEGIRDEVVPACLQYLVR